MGQGPPRANLGADPVNDETSHYLLGHTDRELRRLDLQGELYREITLRAFQDAGIEPGMRVLDIGCGSGDVSITVGGIVGPSGSVLGIDRGGHSDSGRDRESGPRRRDTRSFRAARDRRVSGDGALRCTCGPIHPHASAGSERSPARGSCEREGRWHCRDDRVAHGAAYAPEGTPPHTHRCTRSSSTTSRGWCQEPAPTSMREAV